MLIGGITLPEVQTSFYVSSTGNDSNPGTMASPWLTIDKANAHSFNPGDSLYFRGGDTFSGSFILTTSSAPTSLARVKVSSYGTGKAVIDSGDADAIKVANMGCVTISNIKTVGTDYVLTGSYPSQSCSTSSSGAGILFYADTVSTVYPDCVVSDCEVTGGRYGIYFLNDNHSATAAHSNVLIEDCYVHDVAADGIYITGYWTEGSESYSTQMALFNGVSITGCHVENIPGISGEVQACGFPLRVGNATDAVIDGCLLKNNGWASTSLPTAILLVFCASPIVRGCDVSLFRTGSMGGDGHGIDPDLGVTDAIVEYNYVHDSPKCGLFNFSGTNTIWRYNIVERCNGCLRGGGTPESIYNNSFYNTTDDPVMALAFSAASVYNNLIVGRSGVPLIQFTSDTLVGCVGNTYYTTGGSSFVIEAVILSPTTYTSIASFRAAGYEKNGGTDYGAYGDPLLTDAGNGAQQLMTNPVSHLAAYNIAISSPAIGAGINWATVGLTAPTMDWHGSAATTGTFDSGAVRSGSS